MRGQHCYMCGIIHKPSHIQTAKISHLQKSTTKSNNRHNSQQTYISSVTASKCTETFRQEM